jgi:WD40 repeat protein
VIGDESLGQIEYFDNNTLNKITPNFHTNIILHLKYLPYKNGFVASASGDTNVIVWDTQTWTSIQRYTNHTGWVNSLDQIDNDTMVSGSFDQTLQIWKISTGETLTIINVNAEVNVVRVFSIEYKQIVCSTYGGSNNLQIYNYETRDLVQTLNGHSAIVNSIEMLSEQIMASGGSDNKVIIWDLSSYSIKYTLTGHTTWVTCIKRLSSNLIASTGLDKTIFIWNWLTGERIFKLTGHANTLNLNSLDLYDDQTLISGSYDKTVKFWNITNGTLIRSLNTDIKINALVMLKISERKKFKFLLTMKSKKKFFIAPPIYASVPQINTTTSEQTSIPTSKLFKISHFCVIFRGTLVGSWAQS